MLGVPVSVLYPITNHINYKNGVLFQQNTYGFDF